MTQIHFTLKQEDVRTLLQESVKDQLSLNILTTVFNNLMEHQSPRETEPRVEAAGKSD